MIGAVKDAVSNVASTVTGGISKALGIKSPSKVLQEMGENTGEGFAIGLKSKLNNIRMQTNEMAAAAIPRSGVQTTGASVDYGRMAAEIGESVYYGIADAIKLAGGKQVTLTLEGAPFARLMVPLLSAENERLGVKG